RLYSPGGSDTLLFSGVCSGTAWTSFNTGFTLSDSGQTEIGTTCPPGQATYQASQPLNIFAGESSTGIWIIQFADVCITDDGILNGWGLRITYASPCTGTPTPVGTATSVATNTPTSAPTSTNTRMPTRTRTYTRTPSNTPAPSSTPTFTPTNV